ncbi:LysR family transcriptional regulator [Yoonia sp. 2307UL14-13]|uniref:LysR family transcriptional regulator n=1 Tax=Yoonia sp. 2307UL14-13 TaxID=3126506 RepID=UPI0030B4CAE3
MSNPIDRLTLLSNFTRIAARGSISAAARDQDISQASASRQLATLEAQLGIPLIRRSTHALALTEAGQTCLQDAYLLLAAWDRLVEKMRDDDVSGPLKVVAPVALGQMHLARAAIAFQEAHPQVRLSWLLDDNPIRFTEIGCDLWIRIGPVPDDTLVLQTLGKIERLVVAAPALLKGKTIRAPADLDALPCAAITPFDGARIRLEHIDQPAVTVIPPIAITTDNIFLAQQAALSGIGFAVMPKWLVADALAAGALIDVLPHWRAESLPLNLAFIAAPRQTKRFDLFRTAMVHAVADIDGIGPR